MALMLRRLSLAALVLVAVLYPALRSSAPAEPNESERRSDRFDLLQQRHREAGARWVALTERDSGAIPAARTTRPGRPAIQLRGFGVGAAAPMAVQIVNDLWSSLGPADSSVRVTLVIYNTDAYHREQLWAYAGASIWTGNGGATCVALLPGGEKDGSIVVGKDWTKQALAPCLLLSGFGPPGPALERWLVSTRYAAAASTAWIDRSKSFVDGEGASPWLADYRRKFGEPTTGLQSISSIARDVAQLLSPPYELGAEGLRCTEGDFSACRKGVLDTTVISQATRGLPLDLTYSWSILDRPTNWTLGTPLSPGGSWLSDLIRDQGREKFATFWKSAAPIDQAFQQAFGEDLGAWTHRWSVRQWENSWTEKYRSSPRILGATLQPSWLPLVLGWAGVTLVLTAWVARRRQVT